MEVGTARKGNDRGPPGLQEQDDNQHDERYGLQQRMNNRLD